MNLMNMMTFPTTTTTPPSQTGGFGFDFNSKPVSQSGDMKQIFKNNEITIYCSTNRVFDGNSITNFSVSSNINKQLTNVKVNFLVSRYLVFKVISTSPNTALEPLQSFGIKKVWLL
jgi:hypothetical protein